MNSQRETYIFMVVYKNKITINIKREKWNALIWEELLTFHRAL